MWLEGRDVVSLLELVAPRIPAKSAPILLPGLLKVPHCVAVCLSAYLPIYTALVAL